MWYKQMPSEARDNDEMKRVPEHQYLTSVRQRKGHRKSPLGEVPVGDEPAEWEGAWHGWYGPGHISKEARHGPAEPGPEDNPSAIIDLESEINQQSSQCGLCSISTTWTEGTCDAGCSTTAACDVRHGEMDRR